jgi:putative ABC transport system ATP-binding protein
MSYVYEASGLKFSYALGETQVQALQGLDFKIPSASFIALSGPSGSGKSTLLNLLGLIEKVQGGDLKLEGQLVKELSEAQTNEIRRNKIGFIFQSFHLMNVLTVFENVEYFLFKQGLAKSERAERVREALESVDLWSHREKVPLKLSGGQRQRVAIARALAKRPRILIADEPTASLDQKTGRGIMELLAKLNSEAQVSVIVSSHDAMVLKFCPEVWNLADGKIKTAS